MYHWLFSEVSELVSRSCLVTPYRMNVLVSHTTIVSMPPAACIVSTAAKSEEEKICLHWKIGKATAELRNAIKEMIIKQVLGHIEPPGSCLGSLSFCKILKKLGTLFCICHLFTNGHKLHFQLLSNIWPVWVFSWKFKKDRPILQMQCPILVFETVLWVLVAAELFSHSFRNIEVEACYLKIWPAWVPNGVKFQNDRPTTQMQMLHSGFSKQFFDCWWLQSFFHTHSKTVRLSYVKDMTSLSTFMKVSTR